MGSLKKLFSYFFKRPIKNWNVENRAFKLLEEQERTKPTVAPRHPTTVEKLDRLIKEHPELSGLQSQKDESLHRMLKDMVVEPERVGEIVAKRTGQLPVDRAPVADDDFGYLEPERIPEGRCTIRQSMKFIAEHHADPERYSAQHIAAEYRLNTGRVANILKYFQTLDLHIPETLRTKLETSRTSASTRPRQLGSKGGTAEAES